MATLNYKQEYERYKKYYLSLDPLFKKPENRAYTTVIFSFLAVSLFGWYAIRPTMQTIFMLKREISDKTEIDKKMENKISALIEAEANFETIQNDVPLLTQALPMDPDPIRALAQFRGLASDSGVSISALSVPPVVLRTDPAKSNTPTTGKVNSVPISLSATGPYPNIKAFLTGIGNLRRITQIAAMSFTPKSDSTQLASPSATENLSGTQVQVDLKLNVFYITE